jgi:hypothetical protein
MSDVRRLCAVLVVLLLGSGCAARSSPPPSSAVPSDPVARTLQERTAAVRVELRAATEGARPFVLTGAAALDGSRSVLRFDARALGVPVDGPSDGEYRTVAGRTWLRAPPVLLPLPPGKRWVELTPGGPSLGLLSLLARPPSLEGADREVDDSGRIRSVRRVERKPGAPDLVTVVHLDRFRVPVQISPPPPEEVVAATDL